MAIELVQNDTGPSLEITCRDDNGSIIDLTDANNVNLTFRLSGATALKFKRACTITDPPNGIVEFDFQAGDLDTVGDYEGELEIVFDCGMDQTSARLYFRVRAELG